MNPSLGKYLILAGLVILLIGSLIHFWGDKLHWIGNLPGDIKIEKENFKFYFPLTTMILASIVLSLLSRIISKYL